MIYLELFRWAAIVIGVTYGITQAAIAAPLRLRFVRVFQRIDAAALEETARDGVHRSILAPWAETLIYCPTCVGFWVAFVFGLAGRLWPFHDDVALAHGLDSGFASVLVTTCWSAFIGGNPAHATESPYLRRTDPEPPPSESETNDDQEEEPASPE